MRCQGAGSHRAHGTHAAVRLFPVVVGWCMSLPHGAARNVPHGTAVPDVFVCLLAD